MLAELRGDIAPPDQFGPYQATPPAPRTDVMIVRINGPIEQYAGQHDPSSSWVDGHDTICERFAIALETGDVVCIGDSPGGAVAGLPEHVRRAQEAKAKHGRRCIGFTEAGAFSACLWWMMALCDEIYVSADGRLGSVGARGMLGSIAGSLAKDGIVIEIVEDPDGKAAGAPERPIDDEARARAQRDVTAAADMFRAAVCASAVGMRAGLTPDLLKAMRGDTFQGVAAVDAGFADDVSTLEAVLDYALATAGEGAEEMTIKARAEGGEPEPGKEGGDGGPETPEGAEAEKPMCSRCSMALDPKDAFCSKCGEPTVPPKKNEDDENPPDSSARGAALAARMAATHAPIAPAARLSGSMSIPALRSALAAATSTLDAVARLVGAKSHGEIVGAVEATAKDAKNAIRYRRERDEQRASAEKRERVEILQSLAAADPKGHPRGRLLVDIVEGDKIVGVKPAKLWDDGPEGRTLANLRGYSRTVLDAMPAAERNPFDAPPIEPDQKNATAGGEPTPGEIEAAKRDPAVVLAFQTTPGAKIDDLARTHVIASRAARRAQVSA
jgi:ClpP class serine protease